jgi:hypothetical protein
MWVRRIVSVAWGVVLLCCGPAAHAFCRTMSCELAEEERALMCVRDAHECVTEGEGAEVRADSATPIDSPSVVVAGAQARHRL